MLHAFVGRPSIVSVCTSMMFALPRLVVVLRVLLLAAWPARSQAPGDADEFCLGERHVRYAEHEHPLMDSRDYVNPGIEWQKLNLDGDESSTSHNEVDSIRRANCYSYIFIHSCMQYIPELSESTLSYVYACVLL